MCILLYTYIFSAFHLDHSLGIFTIIYVLIFYIDLHVEFFLSLYLVVLLFCRFKYHDHMYHMCIIEKWCYILYLYVYSCDNTCNTLLAPEEADQAKHVERRALVNNLKTFCIQYFILICIYHFILILVYNKMYFFTNICVLTLLKSHIVVSKNYLFL